MSQGFAALADLYKLKSCGKVEIVLPLTAKRYSRRTGFNNVT